MWVRSPVSRRGRLVALISSTLVITSTHADQFFLGVNDIQENSPHPLHDVRESRTSPIPEGTLNVHGAALTASGNPYSSGGSAVTLSATIPLLGSPGVGFARTLVEAEMGLNSFALYPFRIGQLGTIEIQGSATNAGIWVRNGGAEVPVNGPASIPLAASQVVFKLGGGQDTRPLGDFSLSAALNFRFDLEAAHTRRVHWQGMLASDRATGSAGNWLERLAPGPDSAAVFGKLAFTEQPEITGNASWEGLIVDGFAGVNIDLHGHTLTLGRASLIQDDFSISIGEERFGNGELRFTNGTVETESNVLIQTRTVGDAGGSGARLTVDAGAVVDVNGTVSLSKFSGTSGFLSVSGAGATLRALGLIVGVQGGGVARIDNGGRVALDQLLQLAQGPASSVTARLDVSGAGSHLSVSRAGGFSSLIEIGDRNQGRMFIDNGATADFNDTLVNIGSNTFASGSSLTLDGHGTRLDGGAYNLGRGAALSVTNGARLLTSAGGGFALRRDARLVLDGGALVTAGNLFLNEGGASGRIVNGSTFNALDEVRAQPDTSLLVAGPGSRLNFGDLLLNGELNIGNGAVVNGTHLAADSGSRLNISNASMTVLHADILAGALISDALVVTDPGPGGGGGTEEPAATAVFDELLPVGLAEADAPRGSVIEINGNVSIHAPARVELDVYSELDFDRLVVNGDLHLGGLLAIAFADGFVPVAGQSFEFLVVSGLLSGQSTMTIAVSGLPAWRIAPLFGDAGGLAFALTPAAASVPLPGVLVPFSAMLCGLLVRRRRAGEVGQMYPKRKYFQMSFTFEVASVAVCSRQPAFTRSLPSPDGNRQAVRFPVQDAVSEMHRAEVVLTQQFHRLPRPHAVGAPAIGDDLLVRWQLREPVLKLVEGYRNRPPNVATQVLLVRAHVDDRDLAVPGSLEQRFPIQRFDGLPCGKVLARNALEFRQA